MDGYLQNVANDEIAALDFEIWKQALKEALHKWKAIEKKPNSSTMTKKSFSLFDQLQVGSFAFPVTLEEILAEETVAGRLEKLKSVEYVEDVLPDWRGIRPHILAGLQYSEDDGKQVGMEYLKLHRRWYDQARSSSEYAGLQYELCQNLSTCISQSICDNGGICSNNPYLLSQLQTWSDMFFDMMQRGIYSFDAAKSLEVAYLLWLRNDTSVNTMPTTVIAPAHALAFVDPQAYCFGSWIHHISHSHMVALLEETGLLVDIIHRSRVCEGSLSDLPFTTSTKNQCGGESSVSGVSAEKHSSPMQMNSVAILAFVVMKTRVGMFPWHLLSTPSPNTKQAKELLLQNLDVSNEMIDAKEVESDPEIIISVPTESQVQNLLDIFVSSLATTASRKINNSPPPPAWFQAVCYNGIETIISGCQCIPEIDLVHMTDKMLVRIQSGQYTEEIEQQLQGLLRITNTR